MEASKENAEVIVVNDNRHRYLLSHQFATRAAIYCGGIGLVGVFGVPALFSTIGFTAAGPAAASFAASWQAAGFLPGVFSLVQSAAATNAIGLTAAKAGIAVGPLKAYYDAKLAKLNRIKNDKKSWLRSKL